MTLNFSTFLLYNDDLNTLLHVLFSREKDDIIPTSENKLFSRVHSSHRQVFLPSDRKTDEVLIVISTSSLRLKSADKDYVFSKILKTARILQYCCSYIAVSV